MVSNVYTVENGAVRGGEVMIHTSLWGSSYQNPRSSIYPRTKEIHHRNFSTKCFFGNIFQGKINFPQVKLLGFFVEMHN